MDLTLYIHPVMLVFVIIGLLFVVRNFTTIKRMAIGRPMRSKELEAKQNRLLWYITLPILSADLYPSVAYGPEAGVTEFAFFGVKRTADPNSDCDGHGTTLGNYRSILCDEHFSLPKWGWRLQHRL